MNSEQLVELLYRSLETERGGIKIYETAVRCAQNDDLKKEWGKYLEETRNHEVIMLRVLDAFGLDPETETPGSSDRPRQGRDARVVDGDRGAGRSGRRPARRR